MIVIADTSPLHYLVLLEHSAILQHLYGRVIVPKAVVRELHAERTPPRVRQWIASPPSWLEVREITVPLDPMLAELDPGEREAIALAEALRADALILDEKRGRREAERRKLRVIGTVRVLDDAAEACSTCPLRLSACKHSGSISMPSLRSFSSTGIPLASSARTSARLRRKRKPPCCRRTLILPSFFRASARS